MLATMLTVMCLAVRVAEQFGFKQKNSGAGYRNSSGSRSSSAHLDKAAATIQSHFRKYQQRKHRAGK
ncbi:hypothetical protein AAFF_G00345760 [Aldrovandia affinis]|uniref:Uncharacterized protein n=1 Tax=Aldrovandia affinis TaxID=143900 RepID=A0AAD7WNZ8_9TELE|nr:hypothetical protein AAFF_G00345760 [Aldrovandia affinis]